MGKKSIAAVLGSLGLLIATLVVVWAEGDEDLGPPAIPISGGSGIVAAGTGLFVQPGVINIDVPGTVNQALIYWAGFTDGPGQLSDTITVNGSPFIGPKIGNTLPFPANKGESFRADITTEVTSGLNVLTVGGLDFDTNLGAGVLVIYDDGSGASEIDVRDGHDVAWLNSPEPLQVSAVPQVFTFGSAAFDRTANLVLFVAGSELRTDGSGLPRPNALDVTIGGTTVTDVNIFVQADGPEWDTLVMPLTIPAGESAVEVEVRSFDDGSGAAPESLQWITAALAIEPELPALARITGGGWRVTALGGEAVRSSNGLTLHCDRLLSNNLQINWRDPGSNKWHINKIVDAAFCYDQDGFEPEPPDAPANTYIGLDLGKLNNSTDPAGSVACWIFEDHGEKDDPDQALIRIWDTGVDPGISPDDLDDTDFDCSGDPSADGDVVLFVPLSDVNGNLQFHFDQPHGNKK